MMKEIHLELDLLDMHTYHFRKLGFFTPDILSVLNLRDPSGV